MNRRLFILLLLIFSLSAPLRTQPLACSSGQSDPASVCAGAPVDYEAWFLQIVHFVP